MNDTFLAWSRVGLSGFIMTTYFISTQVLMVFLGLINAYTLRVNISVAIIDMQEQYNWSSQLKGLLSMT